MRRNFVAMLKTLFFPMPWLMSVIALMASMPQDVTLIRETEACTLPHKTTLLQLPTAVSTKQEATSPLMMLRGEKPEIKRDNWTTLKESSQEQRAFSVNDSRYVLRGELSQNESLAEREEKDGATLEREEIRSATEAATSCQRRGILCTNKRMHISTTDNVVYDFDPNEFSQEEKSYIDRISTKGAVVQVPFTSKPEVSSNVITMREEIKKISAQPTKKVSFDLPEEIEMPSASSSSESEMSSTSVPIASLENETTKKITRFYSRGLKKLITDIEIEIDNIPEEAPNKADQVAAVYASAYPKIKDHFERLLTTIQSDESLQNEKTALLLARTAIEFITVTFKTVNVKRIYPIQDLQGVRYDTIGDVKIPFSTVPFGTKITPDDYEASATVYASYNMISDFKNSVEVLESADDLAGKALYKSQFIRASGASAVATQQASGLHKKMLALAAHAAAEPSSALIQARLESNNASAYRTNCVHLSQVAARQPILTDPKEAKKSAIADIVTLAEGTIAITEEAKSMFALREKVD